MAATMTQTKPHTRPRATRPVVEGLTLVATPQPKSGVAATVVLCVGLLIAAFVSVFVLNTLTVRTAYQLRGVNVQLSDATTAQESLKDQVTKAQTPEAIRARADQLGLVPAQTIRHIDVQTRTVVQAQEDEKK